MAAKPTKSSGHKPAAKRSSEAQGDGGTIAPTNWTQLQKFPELARKELDDMLEELASGKTLTQCTAGALRPSRWAIHKWCTNERTPPWPTFDEDFLAAFELNRAANMDRMVEVAEAELETTETVIIQQQTTLINPAQANVPVPATSRRTLVKKKDNVERSRLIMYSLEKREQSLAYREKLHEERLARKALAAVSEDGKGEQERLIMVVHGTLLPE